MALTNFGRGSAKALRYITDGVAQALRSAQHDLVRCVTVGDQKQKLMPSRRGRQGMHEATRVACDAGAHEIRARVKSDAHGALSYRVGPQPRCHEGTMPRSAATSTREA